MEGGRQQGPATLGGKDVRRRSTAFQPSPSLDLTPLGLQKKPTLLRTLSDKFKTGTIAAFVAFLAASMLTVLYPEGQTSPKSPKKAPKYGELPNLQERQGDNGDLVVEGVFVRFAGLTHLLAGEFRPSRTL